MYRLCSGHGETGYGEILEEGSSSADGLSAAERIVRIICPESTIPLLL